MKPALAVLLALCLTGAAPVYADAPTVTGTGGRAARGRTWLTGAGVGLLGAGVAAAVLGVNFAVIGNEANATLSPYLPNFTTAEAAAVLQLQERRAWATTWAAGTLVAGAALLAGGVVCVILDGAGAEAPVQVAVMPMREGGLFVLSARW